MVDLAMPKLSRGASVGSRMQNVGAYKDRIEKIELYHIEVPLPTPLFPIWVHDHAVSVFSATLLVIHTRNGLTGIASGPAVGRERASLGDYIAPFLLGADPLDVDKIREYLRQSSYLGWRNNWIDVAFWDLAAKARDVPLHQFLAERLGPLKGPVPAKVQTFACFQEMRSTRARAEAIERALSRGFKGVHLGVHHEAEVEDIQHLQAARAAAGPAELRVHAHQGWSVSLVRSTPRWDYNRASRFISKAEELDVRWVQEPLHEEDWEGLERLSRQVGLPIAGGDLSVSGAQLRNYARRGVYDILTPSSAFAGLGRVETAMQAALEFGRGFSPMSYSDGIEVLSHIHAVAAWAQLGANDEARLAYPWEPPALVPEFRDALFKEPLCIDKEGKVNVPTKPGLGADIDPVALKRYGTLFYETTPLRLVVSTARRIGGLQEIEAIRTRED